MTPTILASVPFDRERMGHAQWEMRRRFPAEYVAFLTANGCGCPEPCGYRVPERLQGGYLDPVIEVDELIQPNPDMVYTASTGRERVFAAIGLNGDYGYIVELTEPGESPVFLWTVNDGESLTEAFLRDDPVVGVGITSGAYQVAECLAEFLDGFTDEPVTAWENDSELER